MEDFQHEPLQQGSAQFRLLKVERMTGQPVQEKEDASSGDEWHEYSGTHRGYNNRRYRPSPRPQSVVGGLEAVEAVEAVEYVERIERVEHSPRDRASQCINCFLHLFDFDKQRPASYRAISYTWGPALPLYTIHVNGKAFQVRENLWQFLLEYASGLLPIEDDYIWVDQICIDQRSSLEKNHQLPLMSTIFSQASQVVSWLQPSYAASANDDDLLSNPYWTRLWVAQEIMLAQEWVVLYRRQAIVGKDIIRVHAEGDLKLLGPAVWLCHGIDHDFRRELQPMTTVLMCFAYLECEDPRDKIYGLLALTSEHNQIKVDYSLTPSQVFWNALDVLDKDDIVDPTALVYIARELGVNEQELLDAEDSRFQYMSVGALYAKLKRGVPIQCSPSKNYSEHLRHDSEASPLDYVSFGHKSKRRPFMWHARPSEAEPDPSKIFQQIQFTTRRASPHEEPDYIEPLDSVSAAMHDAPSAWSQFDPVEYFDDHTGEAIENLARASVPSANVFPPFSYLVNPHITRPVDLARQKRWRNIDRLQIPRVTPAPFWERFARQLDQEAQAGDLGLNSLDSNNHTAGKVNGLQRRLAKRRDNVESLMEQLMEKGAEVDSDHGSVG